MLSSVVEQTSDWCKLTFRSLQAQIGWFIHRHKQVYSQSRFQLFCYVKLSLLTVERVKKQRETLLFNRFGGSRHPFIRDTVWEMWLTSVTRLIKFWAEREIQMENYSFDWGQQTSVKCRIHLLWQQSLIDTLSSLRDQPFSPLMFLTWGKWLNLLNFKYSKIHIGKAFPQ